MRITALRPPPEGAPGKSLAEGVAKVVCQVDGEPVGPAPCKPVELSGPRGRGTDQDKARGFPSGPGASNSAPYRIKYQKSGDSLAGSTLHTGPERPNISGRMRRTPRSFESIANVASAMRSRWCFPTWCRDGYRFDFRGGRCAALTGGDSRTLWFGA